MGIPVAAALASRIAVQGRRLGRIDDVEGVEEGLVGEVGMQRDVQEAAILTVVHPLGDVEKGAQRRTGRIVDGDAPPLLSHVDQPAGAALEVERVAQPCDHDLFGDLERGDERRVRRIVGGGLVVEDVDRARSAAHLVAA